MDYSFYRDKKVLITGHTGFKGSWLTLLLTELGANVVGYSLEPPTTPSLYELCKLDKRVKSIIGDIRNLDYLKKVFAEEQPEVVFHLAAQPIVRESYRHPVETYETNVMGTVHVLEAIRHTDSVRSVVIVTTDKVYENVGKEEGYQETDSLNGFDPYSNSKSCAELVTSSYVNSFLRDKKIVLSTVRAGNVIGGGDFASDRLLPDCLRALERGTTVLLRNPHATRPFQHVMEPLSVYITLAMQQCINPKLGGCYNIGPSENSFSVSEMVEVFSSAWNGQNKEAIQKGCLPAFTYEIAEEHNAPHEAALLQLDSSKVRAALGYEPKWDCRKAIETIVAWDTAYLMQGDLLTITLNQIHAYLD